MKALTATLLLIALPLSSQAASLTCKQIEAAHMAQQVRELPFRTQFPEKAMKERLLRAALLAASTTYVDADDVKKPADYIFKRYDPIFSNVQIGSHIFQSVDLSLGDNPYIYLFEVDTLKHTGIMSADGSVMVDDKYCDISESDIF